jgi:hypothetical protein
MDMAAFAPYATGGLFAVGLDMAKLLAVITLSYAILSSVGLSLDHHKSEAGGLGISGDLL